MAISKVIRSVIAVPANSIEPGAMSAPAQKSLWADATMMPFKPSRLLAHASIEADWQAVPGPTKVRKAITKRTRKQLHARLDAGVGPSEKTVEYAKQLLEGRDPATVVAALLELAEPRLPCEPREVQPVTPAFDRDASPGARPAERGTGPRPPSRTPWSRRDEPRRDGPRRDDRWSGQRRGAERRERSS